MRHTLARARTMAAATAPSVIPNATELAPSSRGCDRGKPHPLRYYALAAALAGLPIDDIAVADVMLVEGDAWMQPALASVRLRYSNGSRR